MTKGMDIIIASAPDKEKVFAELYYDDQLWAIVSQETGPLILDVASNIENAPSKFKLDEVVEILLGARIKLLGDSTEEDKT